MCDIRRKRFTDVKCLDQSSRPIKVFEGLIATTLLQVQEINTRIGNSAALSRAHRKCLEQTLDIYRFYKMQVESCLLRANTIFRLPIARDRNQQWRRTALLTQPPREFIAVHFRQANIEQSDIGAKIPRGIERFHR